MWRIRKAWLGKYRTLTPHLASAEAVPLPSWRSYRCLGACRYKDRLITMEKEEVHNT